jgi:hypothetical protein
VPELSRCPSGPETVACRPDAIVWPASASTPTTALTGPDPSSTVMPSPSVSESGAPTTVPDTVTRLPSRGSPASPVEADSAAGRPKLVPRSMAASASRSVRCENRLEIDPRATTVVPAGQSATTAASR